MSDLSTIRAAIVAKLASVPNVGLVHDYERYANAESQFREMYVQNGLLLGWYLRRIAAREVCGSIGIGMRVTTWRIVGYRALEDASASEKEFDGLIETICAAFRADPTLGGAVADNSDLTAGDGPKEAGIQVINVDPVLFAGKLCHRAQLGLVTSHAVQF